MVKLTIDLVEKSHTFINAMKSREVDLRDNKIPAIENLGVTRDQNDTIDLTNNDIKRLDNFPLMLRAKHLLLSNNRISFIDSSCGSFLPNVEAIILNNNQLTSLADIKGLASFKHLKYASLLENPVVQEKYYRLFVIYQCPKLIMLDFARISQAERKEAKKTFSGTIGKALHADISNSIGGSSSGKFDVGHLAGKNQSSSTPDNGQLSEADIKRIHEAIKNAKSLDEIARLERQLRSGQIPDK